MQCVVMCAKLVVGLREVAPTKGGTSNVVLIRCACSVVRCADVNRICF